MKVIKIAGFVPSPARLLCHIGKDVISRLARCVWYCCWHLLQFCAVCNAGAVWLCVAHRTGSRATGYPCVPVQYSMLSHSFVICERFFSVKDAGADLYSLQMESASFMDPLQEPVVRVVVCKTARDLQKLDIATVQERSRAHTSWFILQAVYLAG